MTVFGALTTSRQYFALNTSIAIVVALVNAVVTYAVLASGHGLLTLVPATTGRGPAVLCRVCPRGALRLPRMRIRPSLFSRRRLREVTAFSLYLFVIDIAIQLGFNLDNLVIGASLGTAAVAVYAVAARLSDYQRQLCNQFNAFLFPVVVGFGAAGTWPLRATLVGTRLDRRFSSIGVTIGLVGFGAPLVIGWIGPGFEAAVVPPLHARGSRRRAGRARARSATSFSGTGRHRLVAAVALGEALVNLALSLWLVRLWGIAAWPSEPPSPSWP